LAIKIARSLLVPGLKRVRRNSRRGETDQGKVSAKKIVEFMIKKNGVSIKFNEKATQEI
jgi:hypothetical protein